MIHGWLNLWISNLRYRGLTMGLEHRCILVSTVGPGTNPPQIPRDDCSQIFNCRGVGAPTPAVFKD